MTNLIVEIAKYIFTQWNLFTTQILSIIENDTKKQINSAIQSNDSKILFDFIIDVPLLFISQ